MNPFCRSLVRSPFKFSVSDKCVCGITTDRGMCVFSGRVGDGSAVSVYCTIQSSMPVIGSRGTDSAVFVGGAPFVGCAGETEVCGERQSDV